MVTEAVETAAWVESRTRPVMVARSDCATAHAAVRTMTIKKRRMVSPYKAMLTHYTVAGQWNAEPVSCSAVLQAQLPVSRPSDLSRIDYRYADNSILLVCHCMHHLCAAAAAERHHSTRGHEETRFHGRHLDRRSDNCTAEANDQGQAN